MPNSKTAKKRVKVIRVKTLRNKRIKSELKTYIKKAQNSILAGDKSKAAEDLKAVTVKLDKARAKGIVHKNAVARRKSRLAKKLNGMA